MGTSMSEGEWWNARRPEFEMRDGKPYLIGDWPEKIEVDALFLYETKDSPWVDWADDTLSLAAANGSAVYKLTPNPYRRSYFGRRSDWKKYISPEEFEVHLARFKQDQAAGQREAAEAETERSEDQGSPSVTAGVSE